MTLKHSQSTYNSGIHSIDAAVLTTSSSFSTFTAFPNKSSFDSSDIGKIVRVSDTNDRYVMTSYTPTRFVKLFGSGSTPELNSLTNFSIPRMISGSIQSSHLAISIEDKGASPTASAAQNDAAILACLNILRAAGGGTLIIPPYTYNISQTIEIGVTQITNNFTTGIVIRGETSAITPDCVGSRFVWQGSQNQTMLVIGNARRNSIQHVQFDGNEIAGWCIQVLHDIRATDGVTTPPKWHLTSDDNQFVDCYFTGGRIGYTQVGIYDVYSGGDTSRTLFKDCIWSNTGASRKPDLAFHVQNSVNAFECRMHRPRFEIGFTPDINGGPTNAKCDYAIVLISGNLHIDNIFVVGAGVADIYVAPYTGNSIPRLFIKGGESQFSGGPFLKIIKHKDAYLDVVHNADRPIVIDGVSHNASISNVSVSIDLGISGTQYFNAGRCPIELKDCTLEGAVSVLTPLRCVHINDVKFDEPSGSLPFNRAESTRPLAPIIDSNGQPAFARGEGRFHWGDRIIKLDWDNDWQRKQYENEIIQVDSGLSVRPLALGNAQTVTASNDWFGCDVCDNWVCLVSYANAINNLAISSDGGITWQFKTLPGTGWVDIAMIPGYWFAINTSTFTNPVNSTTCNCAVSYDNGQTWSYLNVSGIGWSGVAIDKTTQHVMLVRVHPTVNYALVTSLGITEGNCGIAQARRITNIDGRWIAVTYNAGSNARYSDNDGSSWSDSGLPAGNPNNWTDICNYRGMVVAYKATAASNNLATSTDMGVSWNLFTIPQTTLSSYKMGWSGTFATIQAATNNVLRAKRGTIFGLSA